MEKQNFSKYVFPLTWIKCEVKRTGNDFEVINDRETGITAFSISKSGFKFGFGPTDFKYFIESDTIIEESDDLFFYTDRKDKRIERRVKIVKCHFKFIFLIIPVGMTFTIGKIEEPEPYMW